MSLGIEQRPQGQEEDQRPPPRLAASPLPTKTSRSRLRRARSARKVPEGTGGEGKKWTR